jgi:KDO2-lipid IV(A) lauroyltransferase
MAESGWETVEAARRRGQGVLLVSPHLGNWEIGAPLLVKRGIPFLVLTQAEPGHGFTELRMASRAKWGVETLVVGTDAFAFVEVIKRLQGGTIVALLIDRPPAQTGVEIKLFERPFQASISAAELARATGCALVAVTVVRSPQGYVASILPEIKYDRRALGTREARIQLTQEIMRALEPAIRQHPDQWFHFVPVWPP